MTSFEPFEPPGFDEKPLPSPIVIALKRTIWILITLLIILSLLLSLLLPIFQRREPRRNPENEIRAHWSSNPWEGAVFSQLPITNYQLPITNYQLPITNY